MNIVILDNFDSFTYNLKDEFSLENNHINIWRNSIPAKNFCQQVLKLSYPKLLILSPGPGHPKDAGCMMEVIDNLKGKIPIFGVCLGHQAIVLHFGGLVDRAQKPVHGKAKILEHNGEEIFSGLEKRTFVGRYHSLVAKSVPACLKVLAHSDGEVMAVTHLSYPIIGVQFHPESILTIEGQKMIKNIIHWANTNSYRPLAKGIS